MLISKTTFLEFQLCPKNCWLKLHKPELMELFELAPFEKQLVEQGNEVEARARGLFPEGILVQSTGEAARAETVALMAAKTPAIFQATFIEDGFLMRADVLAYDAANDCWDLYEIKGTNSIKEEGSDRSHVDDLAFQASVLRRAGVSVGRYVLVHLNREYVRGSELDIDALFLQEDLTEKILARLEYVEGQMEAAKEYLLCETEHAAGCDCIYQGRSAHCSTFKYSNPEVPDYSVHDLSRIGASKKKLANLIDQKIFALADVPEEMDLSDIQQNQLKAYRSGRAMIDLDAIGDELGNLAYPLYFLDYETFAPAVPLWSGYRPYSRIPFQFSLHVLRGPNDEPEHYEYLHEEASDPSHAIAAKLAEYIPDGGSVISWNKSFEMGVNRELADRVPEYRAVLERINAQMYDLKDIFQKQYYVHPAFKGKTSIKKVLPALVQGVKHADLNIKEGGQASDAWSRMVSPTTMPEESAQISEDLRVYCGLDTYAMYQIWRHLYDLLKEQVY